MDTTDPTIRFDESGQCDHCQRVMGQLDSTWFPNERGGEILDGMLATIRAQGRGRQYDCIIGLSGGVDSSFLLLKAKEWGLRPLVVHIDAGWNSELAVQNIERLVKHTGFELHTHVVNWQAMRELHLAYLRAGVANQDTPQDHAFFAGLYHFANKNDVHYVLNGGNVATEGIFPGGWQWAAMDLRSLKAIHRRFGTTKLSGYPTVGIFEFYVWLPYVKRIKPIRPLNYMPYVKDEAIKHLEQTVGWRAYPRKHGESVFTKFFQDYYLPTKFGYDMRRPHLSSLIASGLMTRQEALARLAEPLYDPNELTRDKEYVARKLQVSIEEFDSMLEAPSRDPRDMPNWSRQYTFLKGVQRLATRMTGRRLNIYS